MVKARARFESFAFKMDLQKVYGIGRSKLVQNWYKIGTKLVRNWYEIGTKSVRNWYEGK